MSSNRRDQLIAELDRHCRDLVASEVLPFIEDQPATDSVYALGLMSVRQDDPAAGLSPQELRLGRVAERDALLERYPGAGAEVVWNVAEFDGPSWGFAPHMMSRELAEREWALSVQLALEFGDEAAAVYDRRAEAALSELPWASWYTLTEEFVVFTWDPEYGEALRASLARHASEASLTRWVQRGWL